jgi:hypothetical protein
MEASRRSDCEFRRLSGNVNRQDGNAEHEEEDWHEEEEDAENRDERRISGRAHPFNLVKMTCLSFDRANRAHRPAKHLAIKTPSMTRSSTAMVEHQQCISLDTPTLSLM